MTIDRRSLRRKILPTSIDRPLKGGYLDAAAITLRAEALDVELRRRGLAVSRLRMAVGRTPAGTWVCGKVGRTDLVVAGDGIRSVADILGCYLLAGKFWTATKVAERLDDEFAMQ